MWCVVLYNVDGDNWLGSSKGMLTAVRATYGPFPRERDARKFAKKWNRDPDYNGGPLCFTVRRLTLLPEITKAGFVGAE
jgi:hypothetical protein